MWECEKPMRKRDVDHQVTVAAGNFSEMAGTFMYKVLQGPCFHPLKVEVEKGGSGGYLILT